MKKTLLLLSFLLGIISFSQNNIGINEVGTTPDPSAGLDIDFTDKGILLPRLTTAERDNITNPAHSLLIFNTTTDCYESYNATNSTWQNFGCLTASQPFNCGNTFIDTRDGNSYSTVLIGTQCWMAENLAYLPSVNDPSDMSDIIPYYYVYGYSGTDIPTAKSQPNYSTHGVLYNWEAAMGGATSSNAVPSGVQGACPTGWHLPSDDEWKVLEMALGMSSNDANGTNWRGTNQGSQIKSTSGWSSPSNGTNSSGFNGLPSGRLNPSGFERINLNTIWWSSTEEAASQSWGRNLLNTLDNVYRHYNDTGPKNRGFSIRCVQD